ncbi:hypothetical protein L9F63_020735, partial [Diploptera punctata]
IELTKCIIISAIFVSWAPNICCVSCVRLLIGWKNDLNDLVRDNMVSCIAMIFVLLWKLLGINTSQTRLFPCVFASTSHITMSFSIVKLI